MGTTREERDYLVADIDASIIVEEGEWGVVHSKVYYNAKTIIHFKCLGKILNRIQFVTTDQMFWEGKCAYCNKDAPKNLLLAHKLIK